MKHLMIVAILFAFTIVSASGMYQPMTPAQQQTTHKGNTFMQTQSPQLPIARPLLHMPSTFPQWIFQQAQPLGSQMQSELPQAQPVPPQQPPQAQPVPLQQNMLATYLQQLQQTENRKGTLSTTDFLQIHRSIMWHPHLSDPTNAFYERFNVFLHCIEHIRNDERLEEVETSANQKIFMSVYYGVLGEGHRKYGRRSVSRFREVTRLLNKQRVNGETGIDDLHWMCMHSSSQDIIHMIRKLFENNQPCLFSKKQILDFYDRLAYLRQQAWGSGGTNSKLVHAWLDMALFQITRSIDDVLVPMPDDIFHQMVEDLITYLLDFPIVCHNWLRIRISPNEDDRINLQIEAYMREHPGRIERIYEAQKKHHERMNAGQTAKIDKFMQRFKCKELARLLGEDESSGESG